MRVCMCAEREACGIPFMIGNINAQQEGEGEKEFQFSLPIDMTSWKRVDKKTITCIED